jgi:hypothetical protein
MTNKNNASKLTKANIKGKNLKQILELDDGKNFKASVEALGKAGDILIKDLNAYSSESKEYLTLTQDAVEFSQLFRLLTLFNESIQVIDKKRRTTLETMQRPTSKSKLEKAKMIKLSLEEVKELLKQMETDA